MKRKQIDTTRWLSSSEYACAWGERNALLLKIMLDCVPNTHPLTYTEYGCGPHSPFTSIANQNFRHGYRVDIKQWDSGVLLCDLNSTIENLLYSDVGILSGVIEYLTDPEVVLKELGSYHDRLLLSYAPYQDGSLEDRCINNGWRNHYSLYDFIKVANNFGFIENVGEWKGQVLFLLKHR